MCSRLVCVCVCFLSLFSYLHCSTIPPSLCPLHAPPSFPIPAPPLSLPHHMRTSQIVQLVFQTFLGRSNDKFATQISQLVCVHASGCGHNQRKETPRKKKKESRKRKREQQKKRDIMSALGQSIHPSIHPFIQALDRELTRDSNRPIPVGVGVAHLIGNVLQGG